MIGAGGAIVPTLQGFHKRYVTVQSSVFQSTGPKIRRTFNNLDAKITDLIQKQNLFPKESFTKICNGGCLFATVVMLWKNPLPIMGAFLWTFSMSFDEGIENSPPTNVTTLGWNVVPFSSEEKKEEYNPYVMTGVLFTVWIVGYRFFASGLQGIVLADSMTQVIRKSAPDFVHNVKNMVNTFQANNQHTKTNEKVKDRKELNN